MNERVDLLKLVPDNVLRMSEEEFIKFAINKFNLSERDVRYTVKRVGVVYTYLCKLYNISSRYIENSIIYKNELVTQRFIADKFGFNEMTIGRHRKRIGNDSLFIKMIEESKLIEEDILIKNRLVSRNRVYVTPQYEQSVYYGEDRLDFGFGVKCTLIEFSKMYKVGQVSKLVKKIEEYGLECVHIHYITGAHYSDIPKNIYIVNGYPYSIKTLCKQFNCPYDTGKRLATKLSKEDFIKYVVSRGSMSVTANGIKVVITVNDSNVEFSSIRELSRFLNVSNGIVHQAYSSGDLSYIVKEFRVEDRLRFKENSPYSTWYADDTWIHECQECKRKLLLTTEELVNYKHNDKLCVANEI